MKIVVGYPAGGSGDLLARALANEISTKMERTVIVENRPGANGMIGAQHVVNSAPDGTTVFLCAMGTMAIVPNVPGNTMPVDVQKELKPVALTAVMTYGLLASAKSPYHSVEDLISAAKAKPGDLTFASTGPGSAQHLAGQMLATFGGVDMLHVPYKGGAPAIMDLLGGRVDAYVTTLGDAAEHIKAGNIRLLGLGDDDEHPEWPGVPFIGDTAEGYQMQSWQAICGSHEMSDDMVESWEEAVRVALDSPDIQKKIVAIGMIPRFENTDKFSARIESNRKYFKKIIDDVGIKVE